jgi:hypothetical protein
MRKKPAMSDHCSSLALPPPQAIIDLPDAIQLRTEGPKGAVPTASEVQRHFGGPKFYGPPPDLKEPPCLLRTSDPVSWGAKSNKFFLAEYAFPDALPTYHGWLASKKDAFLLVESCMRELLFYSLPAQSGEFIEHGSIFVYHTYLYDDRYPTHGANWDTTSQDDDFIVKRDLKSIRDMVQKTLKVEVSGCNFTVVAYYQASRVNETCLTTPSTDPGLRDVSLRLDLAGQESTQCPSVKEREESLKGKLRVCYPHIILIHGTSYKSLPTFRNVLLPPFLFNSKTTPLPFVYPCSMISKSGPSSADYGQTGFHVFRTLHAGRAFAEKACFPVLNLESCRFK